MVTQTEEPAGLEFPCTFPIKILGAHAEDFHELVREIVLRHVSALDAGAIAHRPSSGGKYVSVTITIEAQSREQLDAIYRELSAHQQILMVL